MASGGLIGSLKANQRVFFEMKLLMMLPENDPMELKDLQAMSVSELKNLYNSLAEKQIKRFESRAKAEERTAQLLREAGKLEEAKEPKAKAKAELKPAKKPIEAPEPSPEPAKGKKQGKAPAPDKKPSPASSPEASAAKRGRGAPVKNESYKLIPETDKRFNPGKLRIQPSSARGRVLAEMEKLKPGATITRTELEKLFEGQNVKSALDVLVKVKFIEVEA